MATNHVQLEYGYVQATILRHDVAPWGFFTYLRFLAGTRSQPLCALCRVDSKGQGTRALSDAVVRNNSKRRYIQKRDGRDTTKLPTNCSMDSPGKLQQQSRPMDTSPTRSVAADPVTPLPASSPASTRSSAAGSQADDGDPTASASSPCRSAKRSDQSPRMAQVTQADGTSGGDTFLDAEWYWGETHALLRDGSCS